MAALHAIQNWLSFAHCNSKVFRGDGIGKIGVACFILGLLAGLSGGTMIILLVCMAAGVFDLSHPSSSPVLILLQWSAYFFLLCSFHFLEFLTTALYQPRSLTYESLIINHSLHYTLAALASWVEYWVEVLLLGGYWWKVRWSVAMYCCIPLGLFMLLGGQAVRTMAMATCGESFAHQIASNKPAHHRLVTYGIYSTLRHPSYFGWFYWSVGTQLLLCNPACLVLYTYCSWVFFTTRIPYEESLLVSFYGQEYVQYMQGTIVGIPLVQQANAATVRNALAKYERQQAAREQPRGGLSTGSGDDSDSDTADEESGGAAVGASEDTDEEEETDLLVDEDEGDNSSPRLWTGLGH